MINERDEHISQLLYKRIVGIITPEEQGELDLWLKEREAHEQLYKRLLDPKNLDQEYRRRRMMNVERPMNEMQKRINASEKKHHAKRWMQWGIAASIVLLLGAGLAIWKARESAIPAPAIAELTPKTLVNIKPGATKAVLTTDDGTEVLLGTDEQKNRKVMQKIVSAASTSQAVRKLNLEVPRGGEFKIVLEDSTEVWLNSESKLIYPEAFSDKERRVAVVGEAYFKVKKEAKRPFLVETDGQLVKVYGTEFNIRSYSEDKQVYTTLLSGSISLSKADEKSGELMLTPGRQALFHKDNEEISVKNVNTDVVVSWRHGRFVFEEQNLEQIMQVLSRWYDFKYRFQDESLKQIVFMGSIPRYSELGTALTVLEKSGGLHFGMKGDAVVISHK
ncbi:FecR domain-containing protein [uncultured Bacteroides sp.]|uniref:FecR family protein n=1 Tax=uncultured Bacteroides sp. TaxID=162156 RepID=UPI002AABBCC7|nr:FecR domain-containing protein [uncultured Bacteroides sp.]